MTKLIYIFLSLSIFISCGKKIADKKDNNEESTQEKTITAEQIEKEKIIEMQNAIESNDTILVREAIKKLPHLDFYFEDGETPLTKAIKIAKSEVITTILLKTTDFELENNDGNTALLLAVEMNNEFITSVLLDKGANPNISNKIRLCPLLMAIRNSNSRLALKLIKFGANFNYKDQLGLSARDYAISYQMIDIVELIDKISQRSHDQETELINTINKGDIDFLEYLLLNDKGTIQLVDQINSLYLALKIKKSSLRFKVLKTLLKHKANPNLNTNYVPLIEAVQLGYFKEIEQLLLFKAKVFHRNLQGLSALDVAVAKIDYYTTRMLYSKLRQQVKFTEDTDLETETLEACKYLPNENYQDNFNRARIQYLLKCY